MLHTRNTVRHELDDDVFASTDVSRALPKYRMPDGEQDPRHVLQLVRDELMLDGNSRQNLATFCQTWVEPEVRTIMAATLDKNMVDKDEYPQTAEIEARCVHILADLWNAPDAANTIGTSTTGSSEAAMLGAWPCSVGGVSGAGPRAWRRTGPTWSPVRSRSAGTSSPVTGTSRSARSRCRAIG